MDNDQKFDIIMQDIGEIKIVQAEQHIILKEHIKRSNNLEKIVLPIQKKINYVEGALKLIGFLAAMAAIIEIIRK